MKKPTIASQFPEMISLEEMKMSLLLMGWKFNDGSAILSGIDILTWDSPKYDILQIKRYARTEEISYFKNWPHQGIAVTDIESNAPERLHLYTYKEALILAEIRT